ncbi:MAG TPA: TonB family protein [Pelobium sp.]|nr:TonB family protein [Pelobium sp.]
MNWTSYLIQANLYLVCFYSFYWLFLRKETFFNLNRTYLLASALSAAAIPLVKLEWLYKLFITSPVQQNFVNASVLIVGGYATPIEESWSLGDYLFLVYLGVVFIMCGSLAYKLIKVNHLLKQKNQSEAFSFFKKIRVDENLPDKESIKKHELAHATQLHSADVLFFEVMAIINWFNPIVYLYKKSIKHIHEFIADEAVLKTEIDREQYALLLLSQSFGVSANSLTNNFFNQSLLKQRLKMMNKTKSRKTAIIKYGLSAPLFLLAMVLSSATISESKTIGKLSDKVKTSKEISEILSSNAVRKLMEPKTIEPKLNKINFQAKPSSTASGSVKKQSPNPTAIRKVSVTPYAKPDTTDNKVFTNVEVLPSFPGGIQAFGKFLGQNLKYPDVAKKANIQGRVFCQFVVEKDGSLSNIKAVRGIGGGCDEEAVRVLSISPKWKPGMQNGEKVRVSYVIPIFFQIDTTEAKKQHLSEERARQEKEFHNPDKKALMIVDGKIVENFNINELKPDDIESVKVLKGESATKKYGAKGKNGVVEITTKKK